MTAKVETQVDTGDPLIDEIRAIREQIWREDGEDMKTHFQRLLKIQEQYKDRVVAPDKSARVTNNSSR
jgi:hypothetical protein